MVASFNSNSFESRVTLIGFRTAQLLTIILFICCLYQIIIRPIEYPCLIGAFTTAPVFAFFGLHLEACKVSSAKQPAWAIWGRNLSIVAIVCFEIIGLIKFFNGL